MQTFFNNNGNRSHLTRRRICEQLEVCNVLELLDYYLQVQQRASHCDKA